MNDRNELKAAPSPEQEMFLIQEPPSGAADKNRLVLKSPRISWTFWEMAYRSGVSLKALEPKQDRAVLTVDMRGQRSVY